MTTFDLGIAGDASCVALRWLHALAQQCPDGLQGGTDKPLQAQAFRIHDRMPYLRMNYSGRCWRRFDLIGFEPPDQVGIAAVGEDEQVLPVPDGDAAVVPD